MSDNINWYEVTVQFSSEQLLRISRDDAELMFQAVRKALEPFVIPKQLDIKQVKPSVIPQTEHLRLNLLQDLNEFKHITNKGYSNCRSDIKRIEDALGFNLKGVPDKNDL